MQRTRSDQRRGHQAGAGPWPLVLAALLVCASAQHAAAVTIDETDRGWDGDDGTDDASILNSLAGD